MNREVEIRDVRSKQISLDPSKDNGRVFPSFPPKHPTLALAARCNFMNFLNVKSDQIAF